MKHPYGVQLWGYYCRQVEGYRPGPAGGQHNHRRRGIMPDVGGIAEAKGTGFEPKIMRQVLKIRKMDKDEHDEQESLLDIYKRALGMLPDADATAQAAE